MKKFLALILAAIMALGVLPVTAIAKEYEYEDVSGTAYISISDDDRYVVSDGKISGTIMGYVPVDLAKLRDIKLENYSQYTGGTLEGFYYDADGNGKYEITILQLFLYVLDTYYHGTASELQITGSPHSMYMKYGFWGHDENLLYYMNGDYPLDSSLGPNMGATADTIRLRDGDFIDVTLYTSWSFFSDPNAGFHYFLDGKGNITHEYAAKAGEPLEISHTRIFGNIEQGTTGVGTPSANSTIYYGKTFYDENTAQTVTTDANGKAKITFDKGGVYYLWAYGELGAEYEDDIVSSPSYCKVVVGGSSVLYGDLTGDGKINLFDVIAMIRHYNGTGNALSDDQLKAADVTGDGKVNLFDVIDMIRYYNGLIDKFKAEN